MLKTISDIFSKFFGTKSSKDIKLLLPVVEEILNEFSKLRTLNDEELRNQTQELKNHIKSNLKELDDTIASLQSKSSVYAATESELDEKEKLFKELDSLYKEHDVKLEEALNEILPRAFAVVKETARRFKENGKLVVKADLWDHKLAMSKTNIKIEGENAVWLNKWMAGGNEITWEMIHYDVQLIGGMVLHQGKIAEMATGEGKTLVATLPAYLNALGEKGVHIVTVNDYLAKRDSEWMGPIFEFHKITVDCIDRHPPHSPERRQAYLADITYGTNNEFGFDYLRDNMSRDIEELVQRKLHFAMVDEVDCVLIDDARTPLIISGPVPRTNDDQEFYVMKPRIVKLVEAQKKIVNNFLNEAKKLIGEKNDKDGGVALFRAFRGLPKTKALIKYLGETGIKQNMLKTESYYLQDNSKLMPEADAPLYFVIDEKHNSIELTDKGIDLITSEGEDHQFFILPDVGAEIAEIEHNATLSQDDKLLKKDDLMRNYSEKSQRLHCIQQLLKAYTLFEKDVEYIMVEGKVKIVDEQTGRVLEGRRYSDGLHQAIEAKENVKVEETTQTFATVTLQNYFRMYHKLCGMTGTAETEAGEFWNIYKLDVVVIPTDKKMIRADKEDLVYKTRREKFNAVVDEIVSLTKNGRPVLVGTTSVEISELLSRMLKLRNLEHQVLNAKLHKKEADIIAFAGKPSTITIATNMAGRGTDIKLSPEVVAAGGLAIIGTERHESRRVDRQLRGRSGRQGDPGTSQFFVSLEDDLMRLFGSDRIARLMDRMGIEEGEVIQHSMISKSIERAQKKVEENNFASRKRLLEYDDVMNSQREIVYKRRRNALYGDRLPIDLNNILYDFCDDQVNKYRPTQDYNGFNSDVVKIIPAELSLTPGEFTTLKQPELTEIVFKTARELYERKNKNMLAKVNPVLKDIHKHKGATIQNVLIPYQDGKKTIGIAVNLSKAIDDQGLEVIKTIEKGVTLSVIDDTWKEHLREMDDLKVSVQNAVYEQKDPLLIYKFESFELFRKAIEEVNINTLALLFRGIIPVKDADEVHEAYAKKQERLNLSKEEARSIFQQKHETNNTPKEKPEPAKSSKIAGRNDKVTVQYSNGTVKKFIKFKSIEDDIKNNKCVVLEVH